MRITLKSLPKRSLNEIYAGVHWRQRKAHKDAYQLIIKSQFKHVFRKDKVYKVRYDFKYKSNALDVINTAYSVKLIEDVIFENDTYKIIPEIAITSQKGKEDEVTITVTEMNNE